MIIPPATCSIKLDEALEKRIISDYSSCKVDNPSDYIVFFAKKEGLSVSIYHNSKGESKAVFQGIDALMEAKKYDENATLSRAKPKINQHKKLLVNKYPQIGSDEVGTGDFFGPIVVVASFVDKNQFERLKELGVTDSKLLTDERINEIGPILIKEFDYSLMVLDNDKYNSVNGKYNMNEVKAKLHNAALLNLKHRHKEAAAYVDQFAEPDKYFSYLANEKEVLEEITFSTKGELHFPSVALSSVIARYTFLLKIKKIEEKYGVKIPLGASSSVDEFAAEFAKKHGIKELNKIVKMNFSNYSRVLNNFSK